MEIKQIKKAGRYIDGNGLYLIADPSGAKRWLLRIVIQGRRRDIGLGSASLVSLADARAKATEFRAIARAGGDPLQQRSEVRRAVPTFAEAAELVHADREIGWKNSKHAKQWITTLRRYANPIIGNLRLDAVDTPAILRVLSPIWLSKPETARRVRQRMGTVLDWAKTAGHRSGDNPVEGVERGLPKQTGGDNHFAAMPYTDVPGFVRRVRESNSSEVAKLGLEFLILTVARTSEVLFAEWSEIDSTARLWVVPAARMKAGRVHRVPLCERGLVILKQAKQLSDGSKLIFPGRSENKPLSNMVFLAILRRMQIDVTAHGFRSAFRDWAAETTNFPRELAEMALAHTIENKVEAAYRRGDMLERRRELMEAWSHFVVEG